jgi:hypothetical protein
MNPDGFVRGASVSEYPRDLYGCVSLFDMLEIYARNYVELGKIVGTVLQSTGSKKGKVKPGEMASLINDVKSILDECTKVRLNVSAHLASLMWNELDNRIDTWEDVQRRMEDWFRAFKGELAEMTFLFIMPHRMPYYENADGILTGDIVKKFPSVKYDVGEAGKCFAYERFTASVYHLMRAAEYALVSVAVSINVPEEKRTSWDRLIQGIESEIKRAASLASKPVKWKEKEKKYSEACAWFTTIKNGWRNPVSHIPRTYSEDTARGMFSATKTLFEYLSKQDFKEIAMPSERIALPEDFE